MVKGLYTASEGMKAGLRKQEVLSNNIANVNTTGFKQSELFSRAYVDYTVNDLRKPFVNDQHTIDEVAVDYRPGPMVQTGNPLDIAIEGDAYFTVQTADKSLHYTRSGAFTIDADGQLATLHGEKVVSETGNNIDVHGKSVHIGEGGEVVVDGKIVNQLKLASFERPSYLLKQGYNLFDRTERTMDTPLSQVKLKAGHLEGSNVNPVETMVKMIAGFRNYEADEKALQAADQTLNKAVNEVGRIR